MNEIIHRKLYIGDICNANDTTFLSNNEITTIVNLSGVQLLHAKNVQIYDFPIEDSLDSDISHYFDEICNIIDQHNCVLVNCLAGISRSATIIIVYLMRTYDCNLVQAFQCVKRIRPIICPNKKFMEYIWREEYRINGKNSVTFDECIQLFYFL